MFTSQKNRLFIYLLLFGLESFLASSSQAAIFSRLEMVSHCKETQDAYYADPLLVNLKLCDSKKITQDTLSHASDLFFLDSNFQTFNSIQSAECKNYFAPILREVHLNQLINKLTAVPNQKNSLLFDAGDLKATLVFLKKWETHSQAIYGNHTSRLQNNDWLHDINKINDAFWNQIWKHINQSEASAFSSEDLFVQQLAVFTQILEGILVQDLPDEIFFPFLEQAAGYFHQKIELFTRLAEVASQLLQTQGREQPLSEIEAIQSILSRLDTPHLATLANSRELLHRITSPQIRSFLETWIRTSNRSLAILRTLDPNIERLTALSPELIPAIPGYFSRYWNRISWIAQRAEEFEKVMKGKLPSALGTSLHLEGTLQAPTDVQNILSELKSAKTEYENRRSELFRSLSDVQNVRLQTNPILNQLRNEQQQFTESLSDLEGIAQSIAQNAGEFQTRRLYSLQELISSQSWKNREANTFVIAEKRDFSVKGSSSLFVEHDASLDIKSLAIPYGSQTGQPIKRIQGDAGQMLRFRVSGVWSPTHALKSQFPHLAKAKIGPEGFVETIVQNKSETSASTHSKTDRDFVRSHEDHIKQEQEGQNDSKTKTSEVSDANEESRSTRKSALSSVSDSHGSRGTTSKFASRTSDKGIRLGIRAGLKTEFGTPGLNKMLTGSDSKFYFDFYAEASMSFNQSTGWTETNDSYHDKNFNNTHSTDKSSVEQQSHSTRKTDAQSTSDFIIHSVQNNQTKSQGTESDSSKQVQDSLSSESRETKTFTVAMYSRFTPFPWMPVGSLLLVQTKRNPRIHTKALTLSDESRIVSVQVVYDGMSLLVKEDSDLYLVINDKKPISSMQQADDPSIHVTFTREKSQTAVAQEIYEVAMPLLKELEEKDQKLLKMGEVNPVQLNLEKAKLLESLSQKGVQIRDVPQLEILIDSWIQEEIAQIDLKSRKLQIERRIELHKRNVTRLEEDRRQLEQSHLISGQQKLLSINSFDTDFYGKKLLRNLQRLRDIALPILQVRYPKIFQKLNQEDHAQWLNSLRPQASFSEVSAKVLSFTEALNHELHRMSKITPISERILVMRFPKASHGVFHCDELSVECPMVHPVLSSQVWDAIENALQDSHHSRAIFEVRPEDLYVKDSVLDPMTGEMRPPVLSGSLCTNEACPVVEKVGMFFSTNIGGDLLDKANYKKWELDMQFTSNLVFPDRLAKTEYVFQPEPELTSIKIPLFFSTDPDPISKFNELEQRWGLPGKGLSPFGRFTLDFGPIFRSKSEVKEYIRNSSEIALVFKVTYRTSHSEEK